MVTRGRWARPATLAVLAAAVLVAPASAQLPRGAQIPPSWRVPAQGASQITLPSGIQLPPGVRLPSGMPVPSDGLPTQREKPSTPPFSIPSVGIGAGSLAPPRAPERDPAPGPPTSGSESTTPTPTGGTPSLAAPPSSETPENQSPAPASASSPTTSPSSPLTTTEPAPVERAPIDVPAPLGPLPTAPSLPGTTDAVPPAPERLLVPPPPTVPSNRVLPVPSAVALPAGTTFDLRGGIGLSTDFTDNRRRTTTDKESNLTSAVTPTAVLLVNSPLTTGQIAYSLSAAHDLAEERMRLLHGLNGGLTWQATPLLSFTATDALARTDEPTQADRLNLRRDRRLFQSNTLSLGGSYARENYGLGGAYTLSTFFQDDGADTIAHNFSLTPTIALLPPNSGSLGYQYLASETGASSTVSGHRLTATFARQLAGMKSVGVTASWAIRFSETTPVSTTPAVATPASSSTFHEWSGSVFNTFALPGRFTLRGSAGLSGVTTTTDQTAGGASARSGRDQMSFTTQSGLSYQLMRGSIDLGLEQGYSETYAEGENLGLVKTRGITGGIRWSFTPSIVGSGGVYYRDNELTGIGSPTAATGTERNWGGTLGLAVQVLQWFTTNADYAYSQAGDSARTPGSIEHRLRLSVGRQF